MRTVDEIKESFEKMIQEWKATGLPVECLPQLHLDCVSLLEYIDVLEEDLRQKQKHLSAF